MRKNDNFTDGCGAGPGRAKKLRFRLDQQQLDSLAERVLLIGQTTDDEALAVSALDSLARYALAGYGTATAIPTSK